MIYSNGFVLETSSGVHIGFALGAPSFKVPNGDCVFMLAPLQVEGIETSLGQLISELKVRGEHQWENQGGNIVVLGSGRPAMTITASGQVLSAEGVEIGKAKVLPDRK